MPTERTPTHETAKHMPTKEALSAAHAIARQYGAEVGATCPQYRKDAAIIDEHFQALRNSRDQLVAACEAALARIESDIESERLKTKEGNLLRAALAAAQEKP